MNDPEWIYGMEQIAEVYGYSPRHLERLKAAGECDFFEVHSTSRVGGGSGQMIATCVGSAQAHKAVLEQQRHEQARQAANKRWEKNFTSVSSGSVAS